MSAEGLPEHEALCMQCLCSRRFKNALVGQVWWHLFYDQESEVHRGPAEGPTASGGQSWDTNSSLNSKASALPILSCWCSEVSTEKR